MTPDQLSAALLAADTAHTLAVQTAAQAAGRALFLTQHPHCNASTWPLLDQPTKEWWTAKAAPILDAVREARA